MPFKLDSEVCSCRNSRWASLHYAGTASCARVGTSFPVLCSRCGKTRLQFVRNDQRFTLHFWLRILPHNPHHHLD